MRHPKAHAPWHFLNFFPLPQGHRELRPTFPAARTFSMPIAFFWHATHVHAAGCFSIQFGLTMGARRRPSCDRSAICQTTGTILLYRSITRQPCPCDNLLQ